MHVIIVGAGAIGLSVGWRSLARGVAVTIVDPEPATKASYIAAGILPAANEGLYEQEPLLKLCVASRKLYPSFITDLEDVAGMPAGYRRDGVLEVASTDADLDVLRGLGRFQEKLGLASESLTAQECREHEPRLSPAVIGGLLNPDDGSVDPRQMCRAMIAAFRRLGGTLVPERVTEVMVDGRAVGVRTADGGTLRADRVVLAAGPWTHQLPGLPAGLVPEIRPEKGQVVRLRLDRQMVSRTMRGLADGRSIYVVPRTHGELAIGATHERLGYDTTVTGGGLRSMLELARIFVPGIDDLPYAEAGAGLRPGSPDGLPVLGATEIEGLILATGHSRIGIQLTPVTGEVIAESLVSGDMPDVARPFTPLRFTAGRAASPHSLVSG